MLAGAVISDAGDSEKLIEAGNVVHASGVRVVHIEERQKGKCEVEGSSEHGLKCPS